MLNLVQIFTSGKLKKRSSNSTETSWVWFVNINNNYQHYHVSKNLSLSESFWKYFLETVFQLKQCCLFEAWCWISLHVLLNTCSGCVCVHKCTTQSFFHFLQSRIQQITHNTRIKISETKISFKRFFYLRIHRKSDWNIRSKVRKPTASRVIIWLNFMSQSTEGKERVRQKTAGVER